MEEFANRMVERYMRSPSSAYGIAAPFNTLEQFLTTNDPARAADAFLVGFERPRDYQPARREEAVTINAFFNKDNRQADPTKWVFTNGGSTNVDLSSLSLGSMDHCEVSNPLLGEIMSPVEDWENHITSPYGMRLHPIFHEWRMHNGIDIARGIMDDPIYSILGGEVILVDPTEKTGLGKHVEIQHTPNLKTVYGHLNTIKVKHGDKVQAGQQIGGMGTTGNSTGVHLHFEVHIDGKTVDPHDFLKNPSKYNVNVSLPKKTDNNKNKDNNN